LIATQYRQSSCPPHRINPQPPRGPPRVRRPEEATPLGVRPRSAAPRPEPNSPRVAHPLVQLILEMVDIVLGDGQLILGVLQPCMGIIKEANLDVLISSSFNSLTHVSRWCFCWRSSRVPFWMSLMRRFLAATW
jgi:hypothetical protein